MGMGLPTLRRFGARPHGARTKTTTIPITKRNEAAFNNDLRFIGSPKTEYEHDYEHEHD